MTTLHVIALAFLIVSFVLAIIYPSNLQSPLLWAVWSGLLLYVFGGVPALGTKIL